MIKQKSSAIADRARDGHSSTQGHPLLC